MSGLNDTKFKQSWAKPTSPKPIVMIGAGGIVRDAHLPAYKKAGFQVDGVFDPNTERSETLVSDWNIPNNFNSLEDAISAYGTNAVYDLAIPPDAIADTLQHLPHGSAVLIQKPMGTDLANARRIRDIVSDRNLNAAINFQLRFSPMMLAATDIIRKGLIGELLEIDVQVNIFTPWHLFPFLLGMERMEISVHSIHYLDMIRALAANPTGVFCRTMCDPRSADYAQTRTSAILDYGSDLRVMMNLLEGAYQKRGSRFVSKSGAKITLPGKIAFDDKQPITLGIRPEHLDLVTAKSKGGIKAKLSVTEPTGAETLIFARHGEEEIVAVFKDRHEFSPGDEVSLLPRESSIHLFDPQSGQRVEFEN